MTNAIVRLIDLYQKTISPDHSAWGKHRYPFGYCRFSPSCSEYAKQSLRRFGFFKGLARAMLRVLRCNPYSQPAYNPVTKGE